MPHLLRSLRYPCGAAALLAATLALAGPASPYVEPPVAFVDGEPVVASELVEASQGQVLNLRKQEYDVKRRALDGVIDRKLLDAEAARRGSTVQALTGEIEKVPEPTEGEVEAFYLALRDQLQQRRFDDVRDQMRNALLLAKRSAARDAFMSDLRARHGVQILLESPRVDVAIDPARVIGPADAPVRIVEFSDFECPYCRSVEKTLKALLAKYPGKLSLAYRDFPLTGLHPGAQRAAEASRCAAEQGRFWQYHDRLFASASLDIAQLKEHARNVGLEKGRFDACIDSGRMRAEVERDAHQGRLAGVSATPSFFINGMPLNGAQPLAAFEKAVNDELARLARQTTAAR